MIQNEDYELIPHEKDQWAVRILTGEFVETEFIYDTVRIEDGGSLYYSVIVLKTPRTDELTSSLEFQSLTGDIVIDFLSDMANNEENQKS